MTTENTRLAELEKAVAAADALAQQKSNFLATMSHEIRTPMQTIFGLLELIANEKPDEKIAAMVSTAQSAASGLLEILNDVLDMAKMDADAMELDEFEVPVRLLVRGMLEALSVKVRGANVQLLDDIEHDVPFVIIGDPKRLRQILMNLCGNALKFTHEGSVTVRVSKKTKTIKNNKKQLALRFEVIDTGIGMDKSTCDKLFQAFTQADNTTSRKYGGTGLGLSISKKLVELMGGNIGVTSKKGKGSIFWFEIPTREISTDANTVELPNLEGISILSVEDHPQGAKEIMNSLRSMGAKVENCATYKEGLELAKRQPFDVAVIDQGLPDGLGINLIRELMYIRPSMGLVMYTVRDDIGLAHSLHTLGVTYLTKPASRIGLGEAVKNAARKNVFTENNGPKGLLIAEDTDAVRDILKRQLDILGMQADFVENGQLALDAIKSGKYGLLITDLHMPEIDGYGVASAIRKEEKKSKRHLPIIVLTADVQISQREVYQKHGFDECLLKPVSLGQFKRLLIRWNLLQDDIQPPADIEITATEQILNSAVDLKCLAEHMGEFNAGTIKMMQMFADMTRPLVQKITTAPNSGLSNHTLSELGHSLKGSARSACCNILGDLAAKLQDDAAAGRNCDSLIEDIANEFSRVETEIKNMKA